MSRNRTAERRSESEIAQTRALMLDVVPASLVLVALQLSLIVANPGGRVGPGYLIWSLSPIVPGLWLLRGQFQGLRRADEYQRLLQLQALAVGFGVTISLAFVGGLLDAAHVGRASQSLQLTFTVGVLAWVAALMKQR